MLDSMFFTLTTSLFTLSICMLAGYIARKAKIMNDQTNAGLTALVVNITIPCMVFISMMQPFSYTLLMESLLMMVLTAPVFLSGYLMGTILARIMKAAEGEKCVWQFALTLANVGFMGFPVIYAVYGDEGLFYNSMAVITFNIVAFSFGVYMFRRAAPSEHKKIKYKSIAFSPAMVAIYIGFVFFITGLRLPAAVQNGVSMVGSVTPALSMMLAGAILAKSRFLSLFTDPRTIPVIVLRLLVIPIAALFILRPFISNPMMLEVLVIVNAMPAAALTVIFAERYNGDTVMASKLVALSSLLCLLTLPVISLLM